MKKNKTILITVAGCLIVFLCAVYVGSRGKVFLETPGDFNEKNYESSSEVSFESREKKFNQLGAPELSELDLMAILNRELALSYDRVMGTGTKGFCSLNFNNLGQVLLALQASLDASGVTQEEIQVILVRFPQCDQECEKRVCESNYFKDLLSRRENYGSPDEGH